MLTPSQSVLAAGAFAEAAPCFAAALAKGSTAQLSEDAATAMRRKRRTMREVAQAASRRTYPRITSV